MPARPAGRGHRRVIRVAAVVVTASLAALGTIAAADLGALEVTGEPVLRPALGAPFSHTLEVAGDPGPTDAVFDPPLPAGLTGTITGHTLTIAGTTPGPAGSAPTTVTVSNGLTTASLELDLAVTALPVVAPVAPLTVAVGEPIAPVAVTASGWPPPVVDVQGLPPGLAATPTASGARVEGTPSSTGTWTATATATNDVGSDVATFDVVVGSRPTVTAPAARTVTAGAVLDVPVTTTGSPAPALEAAHLPAGLALVDLGGGAWAVRGTTSRAMLGVHAVVLTARNALGEASAGLTLTVQGAPQIAPLPTIRLTVGAPSDAAWVATGYPTPTLAVASGYLPAGLTAVDDGAGRLALTGSPSAIGTYFVEVRATNSLGTVQTFTQVEVGRAPVFAQGQLERRLVLDDWTWISLGLPYDSWPTVTVTSGSLPPGMWLMDSYLDGRPTALGHYEATITASNEFGSDTLTLVLDVGQAPDLVADEPWGSVSFVATADSPMTGTLTTVGVPPPSLTVIDPLPPGLTLTQDPLDPYAWHLAGTVSRADRGGYSVRVVLSNGFGPDVTRTIAVRVNAPLRWETPNGRTVVTPRGEPMTPVRLHLTGYPVNVGLNRPSSDGGLNIDVDWSTRDVYVDVIGTPRWDQTYTVCPYVGLEQTNPCLTTHIALRDRPVVHVVTPATAHVGDAVGIPVTVTSTHAVTLAAAGLPEGLSLVPSAPGAWTIAGTAEPAAIGRHTVTLTADNGVTGTATLALELTGPPALDGPVAATLLIGETPTTAVRASGLPTPAMTIVDGTLPEGVTAADDGTGNLRLGGAPTQVGAWTVAVQAENEYGTATTTLALTVEERPAFDDDAASLTVREGQSVSWTPGLVGTPAPTVSVVEGVLPAGIELAPDGTLSGTVSTGAADAGSGSYAVTLQATNRHGTAALPVTLTVLSSPSFADGLPAATIPADEAAAVTIRTAGWDRPALAATGPLPPGLTLAQVDDTTWTLAGTVVRADRGGYDVPLALTNAFGAPVTGTLHLDVVAAHRWTGPTTVEVETGTPFDALDIELTGYPIDHVSIAGSEVVTIQTLADGPTRAAYQITTAPEEPGTHPITFTSDTGAEHTVTLVVRDRPVITAPTTATVVSGTTVDIPVTVTGLPVAGLAADGLPPGLSLTSLEGGGWAITGTPERTFGDHAVTLTADNGLVTTRTITLAVEGQPAITAPPTPAEIPLGTPLDLTWAADGVPTPDVALVDPVPPGLTVHRAAGSLTLTGAFAAPGHHQLVIRATNLHGTAEQAWDLVVTQPPRFAAPSSEAVMIEGVAVALPLPLAGYPRPVVTLDGEVPGVTLADLGASGPVLVGTPSEGSAGTYDLVLAARSTIGGVEHLAETTVRVRVDARPRFVAGLDPLGAAVGEPVTRTVTLTAAPEATVLAEGLPEGLGLRRTDVDAWVVEGVPAAGTGGVHVARLVADNGVLEPVAGTLEVTVAEPAQVALAVAPLREGRPASLEVSTAGGWPLPARLGVEGPLPTGLRLVDAGDGTGHLVGTPAAGTAGRWPVTVTADNGSGVTRLALTLTVAAAPPSPPVWREPPDPLPVPVVGDPGDTSSSDDRGDTGGSDDPGDAGGSAIGGSEDPGDTGGPTGIDPDGRPGADDPGDAADAPPEWWLLLLTALGMVLAGVAWWLVGRRRRPAD